MQQFNKEQIRNAFMALPPEQQTLLLSDTVNDPIKDAMARAGLTQDARTHVSSLVTCVLVGLLDERTFHEQLVAVLGSNANMASILYEDVSKNVFLRMRVRGIQQPNPSQKTSSQAPTEQYRTRVGDRVTQQSRTIHQSKMGAADERGVYVPTQKSEVLPADQTSVREGVALQPQGLSGKEVGITATPGQRLDRSLSEIPSEQFIQSRADIRERFTKLPKVVRAAILEQRYKHVVRDATRSYVLTKEQVSMVEHGVLLILLGLEAKTTLRTALTRIKVFTQNDVEQIAQDIEQNLFKFLSPYLDEVPTVRTPGAADAQTLESVVNSQPVMKQRFGTLPEHIRQFILSRAVGEGIDRASKQAGLRAEQSYALTEETALVLTGLATSKDFPLKLKRLNVSEQQLAAITGELERSVFAPYRATILAALEARKRGTPPATPTGSPSPAAPADPYRETAR